MATHREIVFRPPPGTRFYINGADIHLQFQIGKEQEVCTWLQNWLDNYVHPVAHQTLTPEFDPTPDVTALKKRIEEDQERERQKLSKVTSPFGNIVSTLPGQPTATPNVHMPQVAPAIPITPVDPAPQTDQCPKMVGNMRCLFPVGHNSECFVVQDKNEVKHAVLQQQVGNIPQAIPTGPNSGVTPLPNFTGIVDGVALANQAKDEFRRNPPGSVDAGPILPPNTVSGSVTLSVPNAPQCSAIDPQQGRCAREAGHTGFCAPRLQFIPHSNAAIETAPTEEPPADDSQETPPQG